MKNTFKIIFYLAVFTISISSYAQMDGYAYKRELKGVKEQWHKIVLPDDIFGKTSPDLSDIRIFGILENNDTIEVPFIIQLTTPKTISKKIPFKIINEAYNERGYYYTFEIPSIESINQLKLEFQLENFDWRIKLEGSQDNNEWYTITDDYRILSIKNEQTDYQFTKIVFPSSKYRYYRLFIKTKYNPELSGAFITQNVFFNGDYRNYSIKKINIKNDKQSKKTEIEVQLKTLARVSYLKINVLDTFDYYRPVTIKYLTDSFKTEQGWKYNYNTLTKGTLNSIEENEFHFNSTTVEKLKIYIENFDNQPLRIDSIILKGFIYELIARFSDKGSYFLTYGNKNAIKPNYDINRFSEKIPKNLTVLDLNTEMTIPKKDKLLSEPLFKNKVWLWVVMTIIIIILGWFSIKMIQKR